MWEFEKRLRVKWKALRAAARLSGKKTQKLGNLLGGNFTSDDYSVVVFGSLARREFTQGSDLDWTLLVDGRADDKHWDVAHGRVAEAIRSAKFKPPGREGTFGSLAFSHELVHQIGGEDDTNRNTTRRILLLLESAPIGSVDAYERVIRSILRRYLSEDEAFLSWKAKHPVPRFLLNDFARFWWTMTVDFAYKRRARQGEGAVLRNLKLRMSRKLIYAAGMLACFQLALDKALAEELRGRDTPGSGAVEARVDHFRSLLAKPPLEILAAHLLKHDHLERAAKQILTAYDRFLQALSDPNERGRLEKMKETKRHRDPLYRELRDCSHSFRDGLIEVFFDEKSGLLNLTKMYGVF